MNDHLKQVADRVTSAFMNYRIWRTYTEPGDRAKYLEVLRKYNSFFLTGLQAHFLATIVPLYGLYERRPDGISLTRLIEALPDDKFRREVQTALDEAKRVWRKIAILRNEVFAHLSDTDFEAKFAAAKLSPNDIGQLIELSKQLVNKLSYANDCQRRSKSTSPDCPAN
jgi:AbiU2